VNSPEQSNPNGIGRPRSIRGRGAAGNPANRFEKISFERDPDWNPEEDPAPRTQFLHDDTQGIITFNTSPDISYKATLNPYRGCEHGCAYCYARITHEYLGFSAGLDFETKIMVKVNAPELLRAELSSPKWVPQPVALSGVTDCYQPIERRLQLTRKCLQVMAEFRNPVCIITKNRLVTRDLDVLKELAAHRAVVVNISINSLQSELTRRLEPRATLPEGRLETVRDLAQGGIPVGVIVAPIIPGLNDHEVLPVLIAARAAGAQWAGSEVLRLPLTVAPVFQDWVERNEPQKKEKILGRIRSMRGGKLNDSRFGYRMRGEGIFAEEISRMFDVGCRKAGFPQEGPGLSVADFRRPAGQQMELGLADGNRLFSRGK
jgi:DNA repair photolyase